MTKLLQLFVFVIGGALLICSAMCCWFNNPSSGSTDADNVSRHRMPVALKSNVYFFKHTIDLRICFDY